MTSDLFFDSNQPFDNIESTKNKRFKGLFLVGLTGNMLCFIKSKEKNLKSKIKNQILYIIIKCKCL